jgi:hypothetical protein
VTEGVLSGSEGVVLLSTACVARVGRSVFTERGLGRPAVTSGQRQASRAIVGGWW